MGFALAVRKLSAEEIRAKVRRGAEVLDLVPYLDHYPRQLPGGQRQRVALGRALVRDPQVFLLDEPLSNLDAVLRVQTRAEIMRLFCSLATTAVHVTHDQAEAMTMADRIAVFDAGRLQIVYLRCGGVTLAAQTGAGTRVRPGDRVGLTVDPQAVYLFDPASGTTLAAPGLGPISSP